MSSVTIKNSSISPRNYSHFGTASIYIFLKNGMENGDNEIKNFEGFFKNQLTQLISTR